MQVTKELIQNWEVGRYIGFKDDKNRFLVGKDYGGIQLAKVMWGENDIGAIIENYKLNNLEFDGTSITKAIPEKEFPFEPIVISNEEFWSRKVNSLDDNYELKKKCIQVLMGRSVD